MAQVNTRPDSDNETRIVLLIDDEPAQSRLISAIAAREGWRTVVASDAETAIAMLGTREGMQLSAILLDQWVPGDDACSLIAELKERRPALPILMLTTSASPLLAVEAMRAGASDYLVKPVSPDRLMEALRTVTTREAPRNELAPLTEKMSANLDFEAMIGTAPTFRAALAQAAKAARGHGHALIEGESGTGKEMLMRAMHAASPRSKDPLRIINIASVPPNSIESVLFGHEPNAFPGAFDRQIGALQHCDGGTLVLDEVDRMSAPAQNRLREALETGIIRPVGAAHGFRVDVRLLSASNCSLSQLAEGGLFDPALAQQLAGTRISLPPLRERTGDIPALTRHFLGRIGEQPGLTHLSISDSALALLAAYDWPGNVRQLQSVLFRAAVYCEGDTLTADSFPQLSELLGELQIGASQSSHDGVGIMLYTEDGNLRPLEEIEADVIRLAIGHYRGRMTEVARRLGIGRSTLYRKLSDLGIDNAA
ncbi:sigma-54-dependent Fis family transcriptional regulator [Erythrobacter sp. Dej080120_24]|jgi:DNA-binding NtrC family response regulator|uniref:sigma-54-dependent transcriptional regulator n=1 Tax=Erythrobacter sp. Dej080120_24 TaxID=3024837 RepID=UPI0004D6FB2F|nr:Fis family transcriptional regulator [Erythrobacter sp. JL475]BDW81943.1 sigma-54-dependent Fis family transcriptional regulator [Erythrobacter sp. Dej080120_24]